MRSLAILVFTIITATTVKGQEPPAKFSSADFWKSKPTLNIVRAEVEKGFDFKNMQGSADPIFQAINTGASPEILNYLLDQPGVDLKHTLFEGRIYLHIAANQGNAEAVECLLARGSDVNFLDANGHTALTFAAYQGKLTKPVLEVFVKKRLDVNKKYDSKKSATILLIAIGHDKDLAITDYLISKGASLQATDNNGNTAFNYAATIGNIDNMKTLLKRKVKYNENALFMAAQGAFRTSNKLEVYEYLVEELKIKPTITNKSGQNVLHLIVRKQQNQADIITYFFNKGVDINQADTAGNTPFIGAAGVKSAATVAMLLPKVKNINAVNGKGESALTNAVRSADAEVVELLLKNGADVNVKDKEYKNLAYYLIDAYRGAGGRGGFAGGGNNVPQQRGNAAGNASGMQNSGGQQQARGEGATGGLRNAVSPAEDFGAKLNALKNKGLDVTTPFSDGNTLYHLAIAKNDIELIKKIAPLGIDVNVKNKEGLTALHKAAMLSKNDAILRYLLSIGAKKDIKTSFDETAYDLAGENGFLAKENISIDFLK